MYSFAGLTNFILSDDRDWQSRRLFLAGSLGIGPALWTVKTKIGNNNGFRCDSVVRQ